MGIERIRIIPLLCKSWEGDGHCTIEGAFTSNQLLRSPLTLRTCSLLRTSSFRQKTAQFATNSDCKEYLDFGKATQSKMAAARFLDQLQPSLSKRTSLLRPEHSRSLSRNRKSLLEYSWVRAGGEWTAMASAKRDSVLGIQTLSQKSSDRLEHFWICDGMSL
jgi:hypothetical protein